MDKKTIAEIRNKVDAIPEVITEGIMKTVTDCVTKNDKPYISGLLVDGEYELPFKVWDTSKSQFYGKYSLTDESLRAGSFVGEIQVYEGTQQLIIKKIKFLDDEEGKKFLNSTTINVDEAKEIILGYAEDLAVSEDPKKGASDKEVGEMVKTIYTALDKSGKLAWYPYSTDVHGEIGGFLSHIYGCLLTLEGVRYSNAAIQGNLDFPTLYAAVLLHHTSVFTTLTVEPTGTVVNDGAEEGLLYGNLDVSTLLMIFNKFKKGGPKFSAMKKNILHCLASLAGTTQPATPEARVFVDVVNGELARFSQISSAKTLAEGEIRRNSDGTSTIRL